LMHEWPPGPEEAATPGVRAPIKRRQFQPDHSIIHRDDSSLVLPARWTSAICLRRAKKAVPIAKERVTRATVYHVSQREPH
jgi:hypothetical protein